MAKSRQMPGPSPHDRGVRIRAYTQRIADDLIGLPVDEARRGAAESGRTIEVIRINQAFTFDLRPKRIRVLLDDEDVVISATAG